MIPAQYDRVKKLFFQAYELDQAERTAFLQKKCADDTVVREEVLSLLAHHAPRTILVNPIQTDETEAAIGRPPQSQNRFFRAFTMAGWELLAGISRNRVLQVAALFLAVGLMFGVGLWMYRGIKVSLNQILADKLQTILDADVTALELWMSERKSTAQIWARQADVRRTVTELVAIGQSKDEPRAELLESSALRQLREELQSFGSKPGEEGFAVIDRSGLVLAAERDKNVGIHLRFSDIDTLAPTFEGTTTITKPFPRGAFAPNQEIDMGSPVVWVSTPVRDQTGSVIAALGFGMRADHQFTRILSVARIGKTGETYAFDEQGFLISESRFDDELRSKGLIPADPNSRSIFHIQIRDPGTGSPSRDLANRPLTKLATAAISSRNDSGSTQKKGVILTPYRSYRGTEVIGAWIWLDGFKIGVATEVEQSEAFALLSYPLTAFWIRFLSLAFALSVLAAAAFRIAALQKKLGVIQQLGQYSLIKKIGQGGMGQVYLAKHAMLRRPTAVKILKEDKPSASAVRRFEREVQAASQLNDPHTIEIYDYGRTTDGTFYYAMEYLSGISLAELVAVGGPQPPARVIKMLRQICSSLREAHAVGLIHRDIKPQNIMLCNRGGDPDFVKVLDFGLVKDLAGLTATDLSASTLSSAAIVAGTPLFMAPETIRMPLEVDRRADIYSLGVVGYYALTGKPIFECESQTDLLRHIIDVVPVSPSKQVETEIPVELEQLIMDCLAKDPSDRPESIESVLDSLNRIPIVEPWTEVEARRWWSQFSERIAQNSIIDSLQDTAVGVQDETRPPDDSH